MSIVVFSILFELALHWTRHQVMTKHGWKHVLQKVEDEFFLLGIISFVFFFCNQGLADKDMITVEHFELAHYVLFAIGVSYTYHAIVIYTGMFPKFKSWAKAEAATHNPTVHLGALGSWAPGASGDFLHTARWAVVRRAYIDRYGLPTKFNYGEYLHQVAIDNIAEVMEASWVEWLITLAYAGFVTMVVIFIDQYTDLIDTDDSHAILQFSCWAFISAGYIMLGAYLAVFFHLRRSRIHCLQLLDVDTNEHLMEKYRHVLDSETVCWPDGWVPNDKFDDIVNEGWMADCTTQMLSTFLLALNFYAALAATIFVRIVVYSHDALFSILVITLMLLPYFVSVVIIAPRCLGMYTEIHAFQAKDENVALELQEAQDEADHMAGLVLDHLNASHKGNGPEELKRMFGEFDSNGDGHIDHSEFLVFMKRLKVKMSEDRLKKLIVIIDPVGKGQISKEDLMYWLLPEDQRASLQRSVSGLHASKSETADCDAPLLSSDLAKQE